MITHPGLLNLIPLWKNQMDHHFTELSVRLNSSGWDNISTLIRLREAQNIIAVPNCLIFEPPNLFELLNITNNLSFNILKSMKLYLLDFTNSDLLLNWNMDGHGPSIALTLLDRSNWPLHVNRDIKPYIIRKQLDSLRSLPHIRYVGQCCDTSGSSLRPWHCL